MFAHKFPTNTNIADTKVIARSKGISPFTPAILVIFPKPAYENTFSTSTEPPKSSLIDANWIVTAGKSIFLIPCFLINSHNFSPFTLEYKKYSLFKTSISFLLYVMQFLIFLKYLMS